jgi:two-component system chemotaxis response regulator CheB
VLWEINDRNFLRFRCRVGHAYTAKNLEVEQQHTTDVALWSALRSIEESATLYHRMTEQAIKAGQSALADRFRARALHTEENGKSLRDFLSRIETRSEPPC